MKRSITIITLELVACMASAEPTTETEFSLDQDPLVAMAEHVQNIRSRGKRLQQAIEDKLNN